MTFIFVGRSWIITGTIRKKSNEKQASILGV